MLAGEGLLAPCVPVGGKSVGCEAGTDLGLLAGGSQSVVVICRSSYGGGGGGGGTTDVPVYLQKG